jgi:hypothetical protein
MAKCFTQREDIDYTEIFSSVLCKDFLIIIMSFMAYYNLELYQMDVKTTFLNEDLLENVYMVQPRDFAMKGKEHMGCRLRQSIYRLKQAPRKWYLKFDETIRSFGFKENEECKVQEGKIYFSYLVCG